MDSTSHLAMFSLRADGRLPGCLEQPSAWNGQLTELTLADTLAGDWQLQDAAPVDISGADIKAGPVCLTTPADPSARLCLDELAVDGPGRAVVHIEQEIGRASCRERVWRWEEVGRLEGTCRS